MTLEINIDRMSNLINGKAHNVHSNVYPYFISYLSFPKKEKFYLVLFNDKNGYIIKYDEVFYDYFKIKS
jgi:uncharacterized membrane protein